MEITTLSTEYCELSWAQGFFAEPINFFSNMMFFVVGYLIYHRPDFFNEIKQVESKIVFCLIWLIGFGSSFWHFHRTSLSLILDFLPIYTLLLLVAIVLLRFVLQTTLRVILGILFLVLGALFLTAVLPKDFIGGSFRHIFFIFCFVILLIKTQQLAGQDFPDSGWLAIGTYVIALTFRTLDPYLCAAIPFGTHFLWHLFAAMTTWFVYDFITRVIHLQKTPKALRL